jgi:hypothetical protein
MANPQNPYPRPKDGALRDFAPAGTGLLVYSTRAIALWSLRLQPFIPAQRAGHSGNGVKPHAPIFYTQQVAKSCVASISYPHPPGFSNAVLRKLSYNHAEVKTGLFAGYLVNPDNAAVLRYIPRMSFAAGPIDGLYVSGKKAAESLDRQRVTM